MCFEEGCRQYKQAWNGNHSSILHSSPQVTYCSSFHSWNQKNLHITFLFNLKHVSNNSLGPIRPACFQWLTYPIWRDITSAVGDRDYLQFEAMGLGLRWALHSRAIRSTRWFLLDRVFSGVLYFCSKDVCTVCVRVPVALCCDVLHHSCMQWQAAIYFKIVWMMTCRCGPLPRVWLRSASNFSLALFISLRNFG